MSLLVFEHAPSENTAVLGTTLQGQGHQLRVIRLYAGDPIPPDLDDVDGVISMGGPMNVDQDDRHPWIQGETDYLSAAHRAHLPVVGVCLGAQLIAAALGGQVGPMAEPEIGWHDVELSFPGTVDPVYSGIGWQTPQFHLHGQQVSQLPPEGVLLASSDRCPIQTFRVGLTTYGFQYHFEWDHAGITEALKDPLVQRAGASTQQVIAQADRCYDAYRRLGDRLCRSIAMDLFPVAHKLSGTM